MARGSVQSGLSLKELTETVARQEVQLRAGGGPAGHERQKRLGRLAVRERLSLLLEKADRSSKKSGQASESFLELGLWAAHGMYDEWGEIPAAGVVTGIGAISDRSCMIVANDATVKAGAFFPQTVKKVLRAQRIAMRCNLPLIYLVDSSGVFLPMQDEIFPDEDDFGRIFRNNAVISAAGIPQFAAIMGDCIAGGAYLPVLCDKILMTEGSRLYLAGPALVKAAIGQVADEEELGGAKMHAEISGTVDFREPDDAGCLERLRSLVALLPADPYAGGAALAQGTVTSQAARDPSEIYELMPSGGEYDVRPMIECIVDRDSLDPYKADYGQMLWTTYARIGGRAVGIVASQHIRAQSAKGTQIGGVIYADSADKAARFVMDCSQNGLPLVFLQDVQGFMVGRDAEQSGIIRSGAKLVSAVSNATVPKITVVIGGSFGAGNYALCGKAYDPALILAWPSAKYAVMGADQAAETVLALHLRDAKRAGKTLSKQETDELHRSIYQRYAEQTDIRYGAARGWVDAIIRPHETRLWLKTALDLLPATTHDSFRTGVLQV
jgi:3-methylcrotonyl-CoA carboxylase beta subunit